MKTQIIFKLLFNALALILTLLRPCSHPTGYLIQLVCIPLLVLNILGYLQEIFGKDVKDGEK